MDTLVNRKLSRCCLDLDVDPCRQTQFVQRFDGFGCRLLDIDQTFVRSNFELLTSLLVDVRAGENGVPLNSGGQGDRAVNFGVSSFGGIHNFQGALVQNGMVIRFHSDANYFMRTGHCLTTSKNDKNAGFLAISSEPIPHRLREAKM
jgi:hypothetical protein